MIQILARKRKITGFTSDLFSPMIYIEMMPMNGGLEIVRQHLCSSTFLSEFQCILLEDDQLKATWFFPTYLQKWSNKFAAFQGQIFNTFIRQMLTLMQISQILNRWLGKLNTSIASSIWCCHLKETRVYILWNETCGAVFSFFSIKFTSSLYGYMIAQYSIAQAKCYHW